jgi:hypothetical protein
MAALATYRMFLSGLHGRVLAHLPNGQVTMAGLRQLNAEAIAMTGTLVHGLTAALTPVSPSRAPSVIGELTRIAIQNTIDARTVQVKAHARMALDGAAGLLAAQKALDPTKLYGASDSAGRRWNASQLADFLLRDFAYQSELDAALASAREQGYTHARITHPNGNEHTGKVLTLDELETQRGVIFHPNSASFLEPVDGPVPTEH